MHLVKYTEDLAFLWLKKLAQENGLFVTAVRESDVDVDAGRKNKRVSQQRVLAIYQTQALGCKKQNNCKLLFLIIQLIKLYCSPPPKKRNQLQSSRQFPQPDTAGVQKQNKKSGGGVL